MTLPAKALSRSVWWSLQRRCPACGGRDISRHAMHVETKCPACELDLERRPGSFIGGIGLNTTVSFISLLIVIVIGFIWTRAEPPLWRVLVPGLIVAVVVPTAFYARSRLTWVALEMVWFPLDEHEAAAATSARDRESGG